MIEMMIVSGYLFKKIPENPLPSGFLSRHGVKEKHQPLYQKLVLTMAQKEGFGSPRSPLVGPTGSNTIFLLKTRQMCYTVSGDENEEIRDNH